MRRTVKLKLFVDKGSKTQGLKLRPAAQAAEVVPGREEIRPIIPEPASTQWISLCSQTAFDIEHNPRIQTKFAVEQVVEVVA